MVDLAAERAHEDARHQQELARLRSAQEGLHAELDGHVIPDDDATVAEREVPTGAGAAGAAPGASPVPERPEPTPTRHRQQQELNGQQTQAYNALAAISREATAEAQEEQAAVTWRW